MSDVIVFSRRNGAYPEFSNFYDCDLVYDGVKYRCSEAAWQGLKTLDPEQRRLFQYLNGPDSKKLGRKVQLREDWDDVRYALMVDVLKAKFSKPWFKESLLSTGDAEIIENTTGWHDNIWGNCDCPQCKGIKGQNLLGKALVEVREWLKSQQ